MNTAFSGTGNLKLKLHKIRKMQSSSCLHRHNLQFPHASLSAMEDSCSESSASSSEFDGGMYDDSEYAEMMPKDNAGVCFSWILGLSHLHLWRNLLVHNLIYCLNAKLFPYCIIWFNLSKLQLFAICDSCFTLQYECCKVAISLGSR